jgi:hypothetical protein
MAPAASTTDVCPDRPAHSALRVRLVQVIPAANAREPGRWHQTQPRARGRNARRRAELLIPQVAAVRWEGAHSDSAHTHVRYTHARNSNPMETHMRTNTRIYTRTRPHARTCARTQKKINTKEHTHKHPHMHAHLRTPSRTKYPPANSDSAHTHARYTHEREDAIRLKRTNTRTCAHTGTHIRTDTRACTDMRTHTKENKHTKEHTLIARTCTPINPPSTPTVPPGTPPKYPHGTP